MRLCEFNTMMDVSNGVRDCGVVKLKHSSSFHAIKRRSNNFHGISADFSSRNRSRRARRLPVATVVLVLKESVQLPLNCQTARRCLAIGW